MREHGTLWGYMQHKEMGEEACADCIHAAVAAVLDHFGAKKEEAR